MSETLCLWFFTLANISTIVLAPSLRIIIEGGAGYTLGDLLDLINAPLWLSGWWIATNFPPPSKKSEKPGYWRSPSRSVISVFPFLLFGGLAISGHGMHLSCNSVENLIKRMRKYGRISDGNIAAISEVYALTDFYDEVLSHYLAFIGTAGMTALVLSRELTPTGVGTDSKGFSSYTPFSCGSVSVAALIHALGLFAFTVESGIWHLCIPATTVVSVSILFFGGRRALKRSILYYFFLSNVLSTLLSAAWFMHYGDMPQLSQLGMV